MVSAGCMHSAATDTDGTVWTWGMGCSGQLGHGDQHNKTQPAKITIEAFARSPSVMVTCARMNTMVVKADGLLWTFGAGRHGDLGHGDTENKMLPTLVEALSFAREKILMVTGGYCHTMAVTEEGDVYTWGAGGLEGALGHKDMPDSLLPIKINRALFLDSNVVLVAASTHSMAVTVEGNLFAWGAGKYGQLGLGDKYNRKTPTLVGGKEYFDGSSVRMVACSHSKTLVVTEEGALWTCGKIWKKMLVQQENVVHNNDSIIVPTRVDTQHFDGDNIVTVGVGFYVTLAVTQKGALYSWGTGFDDCSLHTRSTGLGHNTFYKTVPTRIAPHHMKGDRVGLCLSLSPQHALAFAMGLHHRLGHKRGSLVNILNGDIVKNILDFCSWNPEGKAWEIDGVIRLMGGCLK